MPVVTVPTCVRLDNVTPEFNVVPVNVPAAAVTVFESPRLKETPLTVIVLFVKAPLGILLKLPPENVGDDPLTTLCGVLIVNVFDVPVIVTPLVLENVIIPLLDTA